MFLFKRKFQTNFYKNFGVKRYVSVEIDHKDFNSVFQVVITSLQLVFETA